MTVRLRDLPRLPALVAPLRDLFDRSIPQEDRAGGENVYVP